MRPTPPPDSTFESALPVEDHQLAALVCMRHKPVGSIADATRMNSMPPRVLLRRLKLTSHVQVLLDYMNKRTGMHLEVKKEVKDIESEKEGSDCRGLIKRMGVRDTTTNNPKRNTSHFPQLEGPSSKELRCQKHT